MNVLRCIIVEDEPIAAGIIEDYICMVPFLQHMATFHDPLRALDFLAGHAVDAIFLDISMPRLKGDEFIKSLTKKYNIVITTAHHEYGIESYEWAVTDYLVKPIAFSRFVTSANKLLATRQEEKVSTVSEAAAGTDRTFRYFNVNKTMIRVYLDEIRYVESLKEYVRVVTADQSVVTRGNLQEFEKLLQSHGGLRIHRSFLVSVRHVEAYTADSLTVNSTTLPLGRIYREPVLELLRHLAQGAKQ